MFSLFTKDEGFSFTGSPALMEPLEGRRLLAFGCGWSQPTDFDTERPLIRDDMTYYESRSDDGIMMPRSLRHDIETEAEHEIFEETCDCGPHHPWFQEKETIRLTGNTDPKNTRARPGFDDVVIDFTPSHTTSPPAPIVRTWNETVVRREWKTVMEDGFGDWGGVVGWPEGFKSL